MFWWCSLLDVLIGPAESRALPVCVKVKALLLLA
jgi:hypothetical protein